MGSLCFLLLCTLSCISGAINWAVLVAGSKGYENYRHQADVCHAYKNLVENGFHTERIIVMLYDDVAHHADNPMPGKIFNAPDPHGPGVDVYAGCSIDYSGDAVTSHNFIEVLLGGNADGGNGRVLASTKDDNVFLYFVDHGDSNILRFPHATDVINASRFQDTLTIMHRQELFGNMLVFVEACKSGSMFEGFPSDLGVLAMTAVPPKVDSLAIYCGADSTVNGIPLNTCLGDLFSVYWLDFVRRSSHDVTLRSLYADVSDSVRTLSSLHFTMEEDKVYGDKQNMMDLTLAHFFFPSLNAAPQLGAERASPPPFVVPHTVVSSRQASPHSFAAASFLTASRRRPGSRYESYPFTPW